MYRNRPSAWQKQIVVLMLGVLTCTALFPQSKQNIDPDRMRRDLDIMETILGKLLNGEQPAFFNAGAPVGVYLDGYGVIFYVNSKNTWFSIVRAKDHLITVQESLEKAKLSLQKIKDGNDEEEVIVTTPKIEVDVRAEKGKNAENVLALRKEAIVEFLANYADAIGQLRPTDRIAVFVNFTGGDRFFRVATLADEDTPEPPAMLHMTALKKDIVDHRRGKFSLAAFRQKISIKEKKRAKVVDKHIDILADIIDTALSRKYRKEFSSTGETTGLYVNKLGALFFVQGRFFGGLTAPLAPEVLVFQKYLEEGDAEVTVKNQKTSQKKRQTTEKIIAAIKEELIDVLADYGHTLRSLAPDEDVIVAVDFSTWRGIPTDAPERFILKVGKRQLDAYSSGKLSAAQLKKRVAFQEY